MSVFWVTTISNRTVDYYGLARFRGSGGFPVTRTRARAWNEHGPTGFVVAIRTTRRRRIVQLVSESVACPGGSTGDFRSRGSDSNGRGSKSPPARCRARGLPCGIVLINFGISSSRVVASELPSCGSRPVEENLSDTDGRNTITATGIHMGFYSICITFM